MSFLMKNDEEIADGSLDDESKSLNDASTNAGKGHNLHGRAKDAEHKANDTAPLPTTSSSLIKFYPTWCTCFDYSLTYQRPEDATCKQNFVYFFRCPPRGALAKIVVFILLFVMAWSILYLVVGDMAGFHGPIMAIIVLEILGLFLGLVIKSIGCPALLAPLALGIILRNVEPLDLFKNFQYPYHTYRPVNTTGPLAPYCTAVLGYNESNPKQYAKCCNHYKLLASSYWINPIRQIALTLILTRAGLELSPKQLKKLKGVVPALAFIPCCMEAMTCAGLFFAFFHELSPSVWMCAVAGFALSAVSPAVVVPGVLSLSKKGYGVAQGIPTLLIAASSIDDVLAITLYTICLSLSTSGAQAKTGTCVNPYAVTTSEPHYSSIMQIVGSLSAILLGLVVGIIVGCFLHFLPSRESKSKGTQRLILLLICNITCMLGFEKTEIVKGAGSIGVLTTSFVASFGWRSQHHWKPVMHQVEHKMAHIWAIFVPILFGTIGKEIKFRTERPGEDPYDVDPVSREEKRLKDKFWNPFGLDIIFRIIGIILICIVVRGLVTFMIVKFAGLNIKERIFVALAWIPKATVQAALAPLVLSEIVLKEHTVRMMCQAKAIVAMAVFGIIITAPIGALCISFTGPCLLKKITEDEMREEEEFPNGEAASVTSQELVVRPVQQTNSQTASDSFYSIDHLNNSTASVPGRKGSSPAGNRKSSSSPAVDGRRPSAPDPDSATEPPAGGENVGVRSGSSLALPLLTPAKRPD